MPDPPSRCKNCGDRTNFAAAHYDRLRVGLCPDCYRASLKSNGYGKGQPATPRWFDSHPIEELPDPDPSGVCANCRQAMAETRDRRFCGKCCKWLVARINAPANYRASRPPDKQQAPEYEPSPAGEDAVRALEDQ